MKRGIPIIIAVALMLLCGAMLVACGGKPASTADKRITVTLLEGEHYTVVGGNKKVVERGGSAVFDVTLDRGYKISAHTGDDCDISEYVAFEQTVTFTDVKYKSTVRLETVEMSTATFFAESDGQNGRVTVESVLGQVDENLYYVGDNLILSATPNDDNRFWCWSKNDYLNNGGAFYDYNSLIKVSDIGSTDTLYANFKGLSDTGNTIIYRMDGGTEIEQDVTQLLDNHPRANTYTAVDMRGFGIDCDSKYLAGWTTDDGNYVGLGSRVSVSSETATLLSPVWKEYTDKNLFEINENGGVSLKATSTELSEIVVPREINGIAVTTVVESAFSDCRASTYYIPDSVTTVEDNAFSDCVDLTDLYMSDNILTISDASFSGCVNFTTLHLNAYLKPRYSVDQASVKTDVYDRLAVSVENQSGPKLVILGGSSVNYGYSLSVCDELLGEYGYEVFNLGFNATYAEMAQFEVLNEYLLSGDIFLHAPEQYKSAWYGNTVYSPITSEIGVALTNGYYIFRLTECNWQFLSSLTVNRYGNLFSLFSSFNKERASMDGYEYYDHYDLTPVPELKPLGEIAKPECGVDKYFSAATIDFDMYDSVELAKTNIYETAIPKGVHTFVAFPPLNRHRLLFIYGSEEKLKEAVDEYASRVKDILSGGDLNVLLTQYDTVYDGRYFADNDYHLGDPFRNTHTENVISALIETMKSEGKL